MSLWLLSIAALVYGVAGAAAVLVVRVDFQVIYAAGLSRVAPPVTLAMSYSRMVRTGEKTVAMPQTVVRQAVGFCLAVAAA